MTDLTPAPKGHPIKLVRDRTAEIINSTGSPGALFYGPIPERERYLWLRKKLMEEVAEYVLEPGIDELADVLAVVRGLAELEGCEPGELDEIAARDARGGFFDGVMMFGHHPEFDGPTQAEPDSGEADSPDSGLSRGPSR